MNGVHLWLDLFTASLKRYIKYLGSTYEQKLENQCKKMNSWDIYNMA